MMEIQQHDGVVVDVAGLGRASPSTAGEEEDMEEGEGCARTWLAAALPPPTYI